MGEIAVKRFWAAGTPLGKYAIGATVLLKVDGVETPFLVAHHGKPASNIYDDSFLHGTWLTAKTIVASMAGVEPYQNSAIDTFLNADYFEKLSPSVQNKVMQVPIQIADTSGFIQRKCFLLSVGEVNTHLSDTSALLSLFSTDTRFRTFTDDNATWWLRNSYMYYNSKYEDDIPAQYYISYLSVSPTSVNVSFENRPANSVFGIRPTLILQDNTPVQKNGLIG